MSRQSSTDIDAQIAASRAAPTIHASLESTPYGGEGGSGPNDPPVAPSLAEAQAAAPNHVGAPPIRWTWWAAGLAVSLALWAGIASLFGWL